jgi:glycosyltransferase involved in cell wall biosynthesis
VPEVFSHQGGVLIPPENPESLADAMLSVVSGCIGDDQLEQSSSSAAEFQMDKCAERFAGVYDALLTARDAKSR